MGETAWQLLPAPNSGLRAVDSYALYRVGKELAGPLGDFADMAEATSYAVHGDIEGVGGVAVDFGAVTIATGVGTGVAGPLGGLILGGATGVVMSLTGAGRAFFSSASRAQGDRTLNPAGYVYVE